MQPLKSLTIKTEQETVDRFARLKEEMQFATSGQLLVELLDRVEQPRRVADRTKELETRIGELEQQLAAERKTHSADAATLEAEQAAGRQAKARIAELEQALAAAQGEANSNAEAANAQQLDYESRLAALKPKDNQRVVTFTEDNLRVLEYVAARESQRRKQAWSISHVINFFVYARFVKGWLNGDLEAVDDGQLRKLGVSVNTKAKEAVEI